MDSTSAALVEYKLVPVKDPQGIYRMPGARWAEPSLDSAVAHLRALADDPDYCAQRAEAGLAMPERRRSGGSATPVVELGLAGLHALDQ